MLKVITLPFSKWQTLRMISIILRQNWQSTVLRKQKKLSEKIIVMLKDYFLTGEYAEPAIYIVSQLNHESYYARMAMAWFMATAYVKYPEITLKYLQDSSFDNWTYNKAIQKMMESYRVSESDKIMLKNMKK